jgi:hypothetical protein
MPFINDYPGKVSNVVNDYNYGILTAKQAEWKMRGILYLSKEDKINPEMISLITSVYELVDSLADKEVSK